LRYALPVEQDVWSTGEAERLARADGATCKSTLYVSSKSGGGSGSSYSVSFFLDKKGQDGCLYEVGIWSIDMRTYRSTRRPFSMALITDGSGLGYGPLKDMEVMS